MLESKREEVTLQPSVPSFRRPQNSADLSRRRFQIRAPPGQAWLQLPGTRRLYSIPAGTGCREGGVLVGGKKQRENLYWLRVVQTGFEGSRPPRVAPSSRKRESNSGLSMKD